MQETTVYRINFKYIAACAIAVLLSWVLHEFSHWAAGEMLGFNMGMSLNKTFELNPGMAQMSDSNIITIAGPVFTFCQALLFYWLIRKTGNRLLYPFLFVCFYMRLFAALVSFRHLNDEANVSNNLGIGAYVLPVIVTVLLFLMVFHISRSKKWSLKFNMATLGLIITFSSAVIMVDQFFKIRLL